MCCKKPTWLAKLRQGKSQSATFSPDCNRGRRRGEPSPLRARSRISWMLGEVNFSSPGMGSSGNRKSSDNLFPCHLGSGKQVLGLGAIRRSGGTQKKCKN